MRSYKPLPSLFLSSKLLAALLNMQQKLQLQLTPTTTVAATTHIILQQFLADAQAEALQEACPREGAAGIGIDGDCLLPAAVAATAVSPFCLTLILCYAVCGTLVLLLLLLQH